MSKLICCLMMISMLACMLVCAVGASDMKGLDSIKEPMQEYESWLKLHPSGSYARCAKLFYLGRGYCILGVAQESSATLEKSEINFLEVTGNKLSPNRLKALTLCYLIDVKMIKLFFTNERRSFELLIDEIKRDIFLYKAQFSSNYPSFEWLRAEENWLSKHASYDVFLEKIRPLGLTSFVKSLENEMPESVIHQEQMRVLSSLAIGDLEKATHENIRELKFPENVSVGCLDVGTPTDGDTEWNTYGEAKGVIKVLHDQKVKLFLNEDDLKNAASWDEVHGGDLEGISFTGKLTPSGFNHLMRIAGKAEVKSFSLMNLVVDGKELTKLGRLSNLENLWVGSLSEVADCQLDFAGLKCLKKIYLKNIQLLPETLNSLKAVPVLENLMLERCDVNDSDFQSFLTGLQLKSLTLIDMRLSDELVASIAAIRNLTNLGLGKMRVSPEMMRKVYTKASLESLSLGDVNVSDQMLVGLRNLTNLKDLDIRSGTVTDAGLAEIAALDLNYLRLSGINMTDQSMDVISKQKNLKLFVSLNDRVTSQGLQRMKDNKQLKSMILKRSLFNENDRNFLKSVFPQTSIFYVP